MNKGLYSLIGFLLFIFGFIALVLSMVGLKLYPLLWLDYFGAGFGLILRLLMVIGGLVLVFITRSGEVSHSEYLTEE